MFHSFWYIININLSNFRKNVKCVTDVGILSFIEWLKPASNSKCVIDNGFWQITFLQKRDYDKHFDNINYWKKLIL